MHLPRKQASQARARATRAAILEAAARILEAGGTAGLNTNAIAQRAGVSVGSLYQYFPNKEAILAELIREKRAQLMEWMRQAEAETRNAAPEQALQALIRAGLRHQFQRPALAMEVEYLERQLELAPETAALAEAMAQLILAALRRFQPDAGLAEARDCIAIAKGLINAAALSGEPGGPDLIARVERAVLGYMSLSPAKSGKSRAAGFASSEAPASGRLSSLPASQNK